MPMYEITLEQSYVGQQCINRWNYISDAPPAGVNGAFKALVGMGFTPDTDITAFGEGTVAALLQTIQSGGVTFVQAVARNLYSDTDFYTYSFPSATAGLGTGEAMSPALAYGFTSDRTNAGIRRAQKRFVGVTESTVGSGGIFTDAALTQIQLLGDAMGDINLAPTGAGSMTFTPYVFGRLKYHPPGKTTWAYKYYETEAEQMEHIARINQFTAKRQVRTQTSRQYGRGA